MTEQKQEIPEGYKLTEMGVIPSDWDVCTLGDAVEFLDGLRRPVKSGDRAKIVGIYPYYGASGVVDYVNGYLFDDDLILLGEDGENILSRNLPLAFRVSGKIWVNNHAHVMKPKIDFHIGYLTDFLESLDYSLLNSGTAQPKLNKQTCLKIKLVKPSLKEQTAIANALYDVDALIAELEKLIAKKQAIKTATMQQLLTGKTRLPPFSLREDGTPKGYKASELGEIPEDWEAITLSSMAEPNRPISYGIVQTGPSIQGGVPCIRVMDISDGKIDKNNFITTTKEISESYKRTIVKEDDLVVPLRGKVGEIGLITGEISGANLTRGVALLALRDRYSPMFVKQILSSQHTSDRFLAAMNGSALQEITIESLRKLAVAIPCLVEQTVIASILSSMDEEIQTLQQRLNKTRQIKQGMMQELLTGKTRLI